MAKLTAEQTAELSDDFLKLARAIGDFRFHNWNSLTDKEKRDLATIKSSILTYAEDILALSATLVMNDVQKSIEQINNVTSQIKETIQTLHDIQKGINVAGAIVALGSAIISKNPQVVAKAIGALVAAWNAGRHYQP